MKKLLQILGQNEAVQSLLTKKNAIVVEEGLGVALLLSAAYQQRPEPYVVVAPNLYQAQKIYDLLGAFLGESHCLFFPVDEMLRMEAISASKEMLAQRLFVLSELQKGGDSIVVTHVAGVTRFLPSPELFAKSTLKLRIGDHYPRQELRDHLLKLGYERVNKIDQSLQFAIRGEIVDVFSVHDDLPIRLEFFDDELESIRYFDIPTQTSHTALEEAIVLPASDLLLNERELQMMPEKLRLQLHRDQQGLSEELQNKLAFKVANDMEALQGCSPSPTLYSYYGFIQEAHYSLLAYAKNATTLSFNPDRAQELSQQLIGEASDYFIEAAQEGQSLTRLGLYQEIKAVLNQARQIVPLLPFQSNENQTVFAVRPILTSGNVGLAQAKPLIDHYLQGDNRLVLALATPQQKEALEEWLNDQSLAFSSRDQDEVPRQGMMTTILPLETGFELPKEKIVYLTSHEIFGYRNRLTRFLHRYKEAVILHSYEELSPGDYVVHEKNGIGRFVGIITLESEGIHRDYLHIAYAGSDVLYVPLEQFRLIRKFVGKEGCVPKINRLNSGEWEKTKRRIKKRIDDMADRLIELYAKRQELAGFAFRPDDEFQRAFENQFPFELTKDQESSMAEIKKDMESSRPMDRLLCGDVGFGKTELAFRAAFKAILSGKQVGLLCPTTLLARQHYERAVERFSPFGVKVALLSRLVPEATQKQAIKGIADGRIHLVIGTHRLLASEVHFQDLGLLIVDEEQRFGVEQKEKIKELKENIDVLTLSATPIPRTLQMSLLGIRSLSQLNSAPTNRMPIQTYVVPYKESMIRELIERELSREGQVFYMHNRVSSIYSVASKIQKMVPSAHIGVVHGQMEKDLIEDTMMQFYAGDIDILVCTSIIENGIDIANANMIIIEDADCFGLSQLYQIKGRVGRGNRIAYAYLLYRENKVLTEVATKRLKAIQDFTELGSGYRIAQRDLMIRGAGDILGAEQAGFIDTVGIDMYLQLLSEAMEEKKTGQAKVEPEPTKALMIDAYIPSTYAQEGDKVELYQEIEKAKDESQLDLLKAKTKDIYGRIPDEVERLFLKKRMDLYLASPIFDEMRETPSFMEVFLSHDFSQIDGIGMQLFQVLTPWLSNLQVNLLQRRLRIRLTKKDEWLVSFVNMLQRILLLSQSLNEK